MAELTPSQRTWKAFKRNKIAVAALVFIVLCVLIAILGYLVMPDATPYANRMTIQLGIKKPGAEFTMLRIRKIEPVDTVNFFSKCFSGSLHFIKTYLLQAIIWTRIPFMLMNMLATRINR